MVERLDHGQKPDLRGGDGAGSRPWSPANPDFSIKTCARSSGDPVGFAIGIARGSGAVGRSIGVGEAFADSAFFGFGVGVFSGLAAVFAFPVLPFDFDVEPFLVVALCFVVFGFAVGLGFSVGDGDDSSDSDFVLSGLGLAFGFGFGSGDEAFFLPVDFFLVVLRFGVGLGDSSGSAEAARVFRKSSRLRFSSSCARRIVTRIALSATAVTNQRRRRATGAERNREKNAINPEGVRGQAACVAGAGAGSAASRWRSRSRRRIAFNLPPRSSSKQVRYIQVSSMMMEARAR